MSTPRIGGLPAGAFPAPPLPGFIETPPRVAGSEPCADPVLPAPVSAPFNPLPVSLPRAMPDPPPAPPTPGLSFPPGDIASDPALEVEGIPTFEPGCVEITALPALP